MRRERGTVRHLILVLMLLLPAALLLHHYLQSQLADLQQRYRKDIGDYRHLLRDYQWLRDNYRSFVALQRSGQSAEADRLQWIDSLRKVAAQNGVPGMQYRVLPDKSGPDPLLRLTIMHLELGLNHEYQLAQLLHRLAEQAQGRFRIRACRLQRKNRTVRLQQDAANVQADCELHWYAIVPEEAA